jgi:hypothetical protein
MENNTKLTDCSSSDSTCPKHSGCFYRSDVAQPGNPFPVYVLAVKLLNNGEDLGRQDVAQEENFLLADGAKLRGFQCDLQVFHDIHTAYFANPKVICCWALTSE